MYRSISIAKDMLLTHNTKSIKQIYNRRNTRAVRDREEFNFFFSIQRFFPLLTAFPLAPITR